MYHFRIKDVSKTFRGVFDVLLIGDFHVEKEILCGKEKLISMEVVV